MDRGKRGVPLRLPLFLCIENHSLGKWLERKLLWILQNKGFNGEHKINSIWAGLPDFAEEYLFCSILQEMLWED